MVKSSKPSSDSWLASSTVLTTLNSNAISAPKHRARSGQLAENPHARPRPDDGGTSHPEEEPVLHDAGDRVKGRAQTSVDDAEGRVEEQVAVVGGEGSSGGHAKLGLAAEGLNRAAGCLPEEGQDLDGDGPAPQSADQLALVGNQDEPTAGVGHDLLAQQRAAATLDAVDGRVDLVGTVDGQVERAIDRLRDRDPAGLGLGAGFPRCDDRLYLEAAVHLAGQSLDEVAGGASGPQPDDRPRPDELEGALGGGLLLRLDFGGRGCHLRDRTDVS